MPVQFCNLQMILFSYLHWQISKECCVSVIKRQSIQAWKKKNIQIKSFVISPCWSMQKKSCPLKHANAKSHPRLGLPGLSGWAEPFYMEISGQSRSLAPPSTLHREPSDFNQKPLSTLTPTSTAHRYRYGGKHSVVLNSN